MHDHVVVHKGDGINSFDTRPLNTTLYFIVADDKHQMAWMKARKPPMLTYKVILVNGNIRYAADSQSERIYFDQQGGCPAGWP